MKWVGLLAVGLGGYTLVMVGLFWTSPADSPTPTGPPSAPESLLETSTKPHIAQAPAVAPLLSSGAIQSLAQAVVEPEAENKEALSDKPKATLVERWDEAAIRQREAEGLDARTVLSEVNAQRAAGNDRLALRTIDRFLRHEREHDEAMLVKAGVLVDLRRFRDAVEVYETALRVRDDHAAGHFNYGVALTRLMRFGDAAMAYRRAIELDDGHVQAKYNLAVLYQREGSLTAAISLWRRVNELSPKLASGWFHRGAGHLDLEQWDDAATCFQQVTKLEPEEADGWANLGVALAKQKRFDAAIEALRKTLLLEPEQVLAMNALAEVYWERYRAGEGLEEDKSMAVAFARKSLALDREQSGVRDLLDAMFDEVEENRTADERR